ncbi:MAG: Ig family protein [Verrucomicrobia bacterium]|nr:Ig family protein [Verrucomicrobiota bacterium]
MFIVSPLRALRGHLGFVAGLAFMALSAAISAQTNSPSAADGFDPNVDGAIYAIVPQADGKILIGGTFTTVHGVARANFARLNVDGTVDATFNPTANGKVAAIVVQPDGRIVVGGYFTTLQPNLGAVTTRNRIARLNADGTVDAGFNPNLGGFLPPGVEALALQSDGRIVAGGAFTTVQANGASTSTVRNRVARFNADGSLDAGFDPNVDRIVLSIALQADGRIVLGGGFTMVQPNGAATATVRKGIARLNVDGSVDAGYDPEPDNGVTKVIVQHDGRVVAGGYFISAAPNGAGAATTVNHLARFNVDGSLDLSFNPNVSGPVMALTLQSNGGILVGGSFAAVASTRRTNVARINPDGTLDEGFDSGPNSTVNAIAEQSDGEILLGGNFTQLQPGTAFTAAPRSHLARVNLDGTLDADFNPDTNGRVLALLVQPDGKALVGGSFTTIGGATRNYFARLNANGTIDTGFDPNLNGQVDAIALQSDGKILIGGTFTTVKGVAKLRVARLNTDGSLDASFEPNFDAQVNALALQSDGKILVGGYFLSLRPNGSSQSIARNRLARLNTDGSLDSPFDPQAGGAVFAIKIQGDGKILVGGNFLGFATGNRANIARINTDGTLDATYNPSADKQVNAIAVQADGKVIIGGAFTFLQPTNAPTVTVTTVNADGTTTTGKTTTSFRRGIARLNTDGTVDPDYDPGANNVVRSLALQADGKVIAGGLFTQFASDVDNPTAVPRSYLARINADGVVDSAFDAGIGERVGNQVIAIAVQPDARILIGGAFTTLKSNTASPVARNQLARLNADASVDSTFLVPGTGGSTGAVINSLTVQADGRILVGGAFTSLGGNSSANLARFNTESVPDLAFNPDANGPVNAVATRLNGGTVGTQLTNLAWLNSDGTLRTSFRPGGTTQLGGQISSVLVQPDGKILLAGNIIDLTGQTGGFLIRLNADGSLDTGFNPRPDATVNAIALQPDGKIVLGGAFLNVGGTSRQYIARVNSDGSLDTAFNPTANGTVNTLLVQPNGYILLGGSFTSIQPNGATSSTSINYVARVKADGSYDNTLNPNPNSAVYTMVLQPDGALLVGGAFTTMIASSGSTTVLTRNHIARIKADNSVDATFDPGASGNVVALALQPDGKVVLGGSFSFLQANGSATIITRNNLARVNSDGSLDTTFDPNVNAPVATLALQADGKIIAGGTFTTLKPAGSTVAVSRARLARLNSDGTVDGAFDPNPNGTVTALAVTSDGSILVGGLFTTLEPSGSILVGGSFSSIGGSALSNLALLNSGGSASASFAPNPNGAVYSVALRPDGRAIVAGTFTTIAGATRTGVAQLNAAGTIDTTFSASPSATGGPAVLVLQPDGKVLLGGTSVGFGGAAHGTLERLNADGTLDASFNPAALGAVNVIALQPDGKILVGGAAPGQLVRLNANGTTDSTFSASPNGNVNSIIVQSNGSIIVGGAFTAIGGVSVSSLAQLASTGAADPAFNPNVNGSVTATALTRSGKVIFGGGFSSVGTLARYGLARVASSTPVLEALTVDSTFTTITWTRTGSGPAVSSVILEDSSDGRTWTTLGQAARVGTSDTWQLAGATLPANSAVFLRARGTTPTSQYGSSGVVETVRVIFSGAVPVTPQILSATTASGTLGSNFYYGIITNVTGATFSATGLPAGLSIDPATGIISGTTTQTGTFNVTLKATTSAGSATANLVLIVNPSAGGASVVRFINLSTRAQVTAGDPLIAGLVIGGTTTQTVLLRAVGPGLTPFGVTGIAHPQLGVFNSAGTLVGSNAGWGGSATLTGVFNQVGAFPLIAGSADAALLVSLAPGRYSVVVSDTTGASGIALTEVYDTGTDSSAAAPRLVNLSSRSTANSGATTLIGGFVVSGSASKRILIRGVGPALGNYGVSAYMADPVLNLYDAGGVVIAQNDNWGTPVTVTAGQPGATGAEIALAATQAGAFAFGSGSADAAIIVNLPPGTYSAQVKSSTGTTGTALVEIYELP